MSLAINYGKVALQSKGAASPPPAPITGLIFPSNDDPAGTVQFRFSTPPNIKPLTVMLKAFPINHAGFYTFFFHGPEDGTFSGASDYFGCHPYPDTPGASTHKFEISVEGADDTTADNGQSSVVAYDQWYNQAATSEDTSGTVTTIRYWYDLLDTPLKVITHPTIHGVLNNASDPCIVFGDAPWNPNNERASSIQRGFAIFDTDLTTAQIEALTVIEQDAGFIAECTSLGVLANLWYLNMNPTPSDISDKSGNGNHPAWLNANRPTLYEG